MGNVAYLYYICNYRYTSADAGIEGMAYHYFCCNGLWTYEYEKDESGIVNANKRNFYSQNSKNPYKFSNEYRLDGEPQGKSQSLKMGQYVNPVCRLKMRQSPVLSSMEIMLLKPRTLLRIVETGDRETIDGLSANWVKVEPVNDDRSVEGYVIKNWLPAEETSAWVFGGYVE